MLFGLFKKGVSSDDFASGLFYAITKSQIVEEPIRDLGGSELLSREDKVYLLMARLHHLMSIRKLERAQMVLLIRVAENLYGVKPEVLAITPKGVPLTNDQVMLAEKLVDVTVKISEINAYFKNLPSRESFVRSPFAIDHNFDPIQKAQVLAWYFSGQQLVDSGFDASLKNFKVIDS